MSLLANNEEPLRVLSATYLRCVAELLDRDCHIACVIYSEADSHAIDTAFIVSESRYDAALVVEPLVRDIIREQSERN